MKQITSISLLLLLTFSVIFSKAQSRLEIPFNKSWHFTGGSVTGETINKMEAQTGQSIFLYHSYY